MTSISYNYVCTVDVIHNSFSSQKEVADDPNPNTLSHIWSRRVNTCRFRPLYALAGFMVTVFHDKYQNIAKLLLSMHKKHFSSFQLSIPQEVLFVSDNITAEARFDSGSNVAVEWWMSDSPQVCYDSDVDKNGRLSHLTGHAATEGRRDIHMVASNAFGSQGTHSSVYVLPQNARVSFVLEKQNFTTAENVTINVSTQSNANQQPIHLHVNWGDNSSSFYNGKAKFSPGSRFKISHRFGHDGKFDIENLVVYNYQGNNVTWRKRINVEVVKDSDVSLNITGNTIYVTPGELLTLNVIGGANSTVTVKCSGPSLCGTLCNNFQCTLFYHDVVRQNIYLNRMSKNRNSTKVYTLVVDHDIKSNLEMKCYRKNIIYMQEELHFQLILTTSFDIPSTINCSLDGTNLGEFTISAQRNTDIKTANNYGIGTHILSLLCHNLRSQVYFNVSVSVFENPCMNVKSIPGNLMRRVIRAYSLYEISITSNIGIYCDLCSSSPKYLWTISNTPIPGRIGSGRSLRLSAGYLRAGEYQVVLNVTLGGCNLRNTTVKTLWRTDEYHLTVVAPSPMAYISGGHLRNANAGENVSLTTMARFHLKDKLNITWNCRR